MPGPLDSDAARTLASGRETLGSLISAAQSRLQRVFIVFVVAFLGTFWGMRFVWDRLKADLLTNMGLSPEDAPEVVAVTPFDVILLQVKIGLIVGILVSIPVVVWYGRDALKDRGIWPDHTQPRWKLALFGLAISGLFLVGFLYAYTLFFPIMFRFLATNAVQAGFTPTYSIVKWTEFIFFLTVSFGLAAQLPLAMSAAAAAGVVSYETFRDKWRWAVMGIFGFGAVFSPPDPFTQIMWALPLIGLYVVSLGVTRLVVLAQQAGEHVPLRRVAIDRWNVLAGTFVLVGAGGYLFLRRGGLSAVNEILRMVGSSYRAPPADQLTLFSLSPTVTAGVIGVALGGLALAVVLFYYRIKALEEVQVTEGVGGEAVGEPAEIDIGALSTAGVRAAPPEAFTELSEAEALQYAEAAMEAEEPERAQAILDRFDEAEAAAEETAEDESDPVASTAAGMMDAFTEEETTEEDIGGYYYDIQFVIESLTSKAMWLVGVFMVVLAGTFVALYSGGIGVLKQTFLTHMPPDLRPQVDIVTLHPVEALIFEVKFSTLLAAVSVVPLLLYWAWPALRERGLVGGDRRVLFVWGGTLVLALVGGSLVGFFYIAPAIISFLAQDAIASHMVIAYRINHFGWLVVFTTIGIGILTEIPVTMLLFHRGGLVSYETMHRRWRPVVIGLFAISAVVSPRGVFTMLLLAIPAALAYGVGLALLWVLTIRSRRRRGRARPVG